MSNRITALKLRLAKTMSSFENARRTDGASTLNGRIPPAQEKVLDSVINQAQAIAAAETGNDSTQDHDERLKRAYSERTACAVAMARFALMCGFKAGVGKDSNLDWDDDWRVVLYVETPAGQVSWHIAPHDQHMLDGLPAYEGQWDGTFRSRDGSFCKWPHEAAQHQDHGASNASMLEVANLLATYPDEFFDGLGSDGEFRGQDKSSPAPERPL